QPQPTPFPYPTLFRSGPTSTWPRNASPYTDACIAAASTPPNPATETAPCRSPPASPKASPACAKAQPTRHHSSPPRSAATSTPRSEEHTSELQSLAYL